MSSQSHSHPQPSSALTATDVTHHFQGKSDESLLVLSQVSLTISSGSFVSIVGPSGCGKTTLLNMFAGLLTPSSGEVAREQQAIAGIDRSVGYMSARASLMPWRTAGRNVEYGMELRHIRKTERQERAEELLSLVGLGTFYNSHPHELSQGMRQRVSLARTLAIDPSCLLMDEPFGALDAQTKLLLQREFLRIWEDMGQTVVLVTHDLEEAVLMSDRVIVMTSRPGRIKADMAIDLERPRDLEEARREGAFIEAYDELWGSLREEVIHDE